MINFLLLVLQFVMDFIILAIYMAFFLPFLAFILPPSWLKTAESIPYFEVYFLALSLLIPTLLSRFSFFQSILVSLQGVHKARGQELEIIEAALNPVLRQAGLRREDFSLYVDNRDELNAYAIGDRHIVVTRPLLTYLPVPKISGILAHELGHLQHPPHAVASHELRHEHAPGHFQLDLPHPGGDSLHFSGHSVCGPRHFPFRVLLQYVDPPDQCPDGAAHSFADAVQCTAK
jgi:hypothetical protein